MRVPGRWDRMVSNSVTIAGTSGTQFENLRCAPKNTANKLQQAITFWISLASIGFSGLQWPFAEGNISISRSLATALSKHWMCVGSCPHILFGLQKIVSSYGVVSKFGKPFESCRRVGDCRQFSYQTWNNYQNEKGIVCGDLRSQPNCVLHSFLDSCEFLCWYHYLLANQS